MRFRRTLPLIATLAMLSLAARAQQAAAAAAPKLVEVIGQLRITGGNPGAGRVLTSDADGLGNWTAPVTSTLVCVGRLPEKAATDVLLDLPISVDPATIVGITAVVQLP